MPVKFRHALLLTAAALQPAIAADLATLFTTPQERQLINNNRYRNSENESKPVKIEQPEQAPIQHVPREEVTREYLISGITISKSGPHTVWINSVAYEDGGRLEDNSRIKVFADGDIRVRITAPDGKQYYATSGETLEITYLAPVKSQG